MLQISRKNQTKFQAVDSHLTLKSPSVCLSFIPFKFSSTALRQASACRNASFVKSNRYVHIRHDDNNIIMNTKSPSILINYYKHLDRISSC